VGLTVERRDLRDAVRRLIAKTDPVASAWPRLCEEIGVAGLAIPERYGGAGAGLAETCVVMEELGRNLTQAPMLGSAVLAAQAVLASGDEAARERLLPAIADGSAIAALAWTTPTGHWGTAELGYDARAVGRHWRLAGQAHYVLDGAAADVLLVAATTPNGTGLFEVDPRQDGVVRTPVTAMDASRDLAVVRLADVTGRRIGGDAAAPLAHARDQACLALGAEQVGAAERALELTVAHLQTRIQFGQPIGAFQALQHRAADLHVLVESARSLSRAMAAGLAPGPDLGLRAAAVKVYCSETLTQTASEMIQLHGAIGVTWEHQAHRYLKRAHSGRHLFGSPARHLSAIAARLIDAPAPGITPDWWAVVQLGSRSPASAPPQQVRRHRRRRLDEALGFKPGVKQRVQVGGQLAVGRAHPDPDALGIVVLRRDPPSLGLVSLPWRPTARPPLATRKARMHDRGDEPATRPQHRRHGSERTRQVVDVHQRHLAGAAVEGPPVPPAEVASDVGVEVGDVRRADRARPAEHRGRDVHAGHVSPQADQMTAHPPLTAPDVQHPVTADVRQQAVLRRDERWPVATPLLIPLGELVVPRLRLRHLPTLTA
jgi:alkylation response protein AidB-like acyl-CoA dehydrogenase